MLYLNKILIPTDFSDAANAVLLPALCLAEQFDASLHVLHLDRPTAGPAATNESFWTRFQAEIEAYRQTHPLTCLPDDLHVHSIKVNPASVNQAILGYADKYKFHLIVLGTQAHAGFSHLFMGSVAEEVVRRAPCPVLTLRVQTSPVPAPARIRHILVPTDFSDCSQHALMHAKELAHRLDAHLTVLHVIQKRTLLHASLNPELQHLIQATMNPAFYDEHLRSLYASVPGPEVAVTFHAVGGQVPQEIATFADSHDVDLTLLSTHGMTGVRHFLLGSVTEQVVRRTTSPVLTIKAFGKSLVLASPSHFPQPAMASFMTMLFDTTPVIASEGTPIAEPTHLAGVG